MAIAGVDDVRRTEKVSTNAGPRAPRRRWFLRVRPWLSTVLVLVLWQVLASAGAVSAQVLPGPITLVGTGWTMILDGSLPEALRVSLLRVLAGATIGIAAGLALGLLSGFVRWGEDIIDKPLQMIRTVPFTALSPLLILWFGLQETPKVVLIVIATVVPTYLNTFSGVRNVDRKLVEVGTAYTFTPWQTATRVLLPGAVPAIMVGLRQALGVAWIAVIIAEMVNANAGIGYLLTNARTYVRTDVVMVCVVLYAVLGLVTDGIVRAVEKPLLRWRNPQR